MNRTTVAAYDANAGRYATAYDAAQPGATLSFLLYFREQYGRDDGMEG